MDTLNDWLTELTDALNALYGLPGIALVALLCLVGGYVLKLQRWFPNEAIPLALVLMGGGLLPLVSDWAGSNLPFRIWLVRNLIVGCLIGLGTWLGHKLVIKRIEDKIPWLREFLEGDGKANGNAPKPPTP